MKPLPTPVLFLNKARLVAALLLWMIASSAHAASLFIKANQNDVWDSSWGIPEPTGSDVVVWVGMTSGPCAGGLCDELDEIMRNFVTNGVHVFIGPGEFGTQGVWNGNWGQTNSPGFRVPSDCWITGSKWPPGLCTTNTDIFRLSCLPNPCNRTTLLLTNLSPAAVENTVLSTWLTNTAPGLASRVASHVLSRFYSSILIGSSTCNIVLEPFTRGGGEVC